MSAVSPLVRSRARRVVPSVIVTGAMAASVVLLSPAAPSSAAETLHVSKSGSDSARGTSTSPLRSVQAAVNKASAGSTILVHRGSYSGRVTITKSGITLRAAGDGPVELTSSFPGRSCGATSPAVDRTVTVKDGADHVTISGFTIRNGVWISGDNANRFTKWFSGKQSAGAWQERRAIPGQNANNPTAARTAVSYMNRKLGLSGTEALDPADGVNVIGNTITGRGIHATLARDGQLLNNTIRDIDCGTGPGVWVVALSSSWEVRGNDVTNVKDTAKHHMQEGIRISDAASYNTVVGNRVHDLPTDGRGLTTDVDASYNTFQGNTATNLYIGFSDEMSGKGNRWIGNSVSGARKHAFGLMSPDWNAARPSLDTSTQDVYMSCNRVTKSAGPQFVAGSSIGGRFEKNSFTSTFVAPNLVTYWASAGNTWNGLSKAPARDLIAATYTGC